MRMGAAVPKQFLSLAGKPMIFHTITKFIDFDPDIEVLIVLPEGYQDRWQELCLESGFIYDHKTVVGGKERYFSVKNALSLVGRESFVAVHDAVRPLVSAETIDKCFTIAAEKGNAVPFIKPPESVREIISNKRNRRLQRENIALIQTPQVFRSDILLAAYDRAYDYAYTDDATVVEAAGYKINLVEGNPENIKITTTEDLLVAESMIKEGLSR